MSASSTTRFDIDDLSLAVSEEWHPIPLNPEQASRRWAKDLAATLATGTEATHLAGHLASLRARLLRLKDANMSAAVYLPHASEGVIDCLLTYTVAKYSSKSSGPAFLREAEEQEGRRSPGMHIHDVKTWTNATPAGKLVGVRTINSYHEPGRKPWAEERVVINVYPSKARQFAQMIFTTSTPDSFDDLQLFATDIAKELTVELTVAEDVPSKQPHRIASAHPVDNSFGQSILASKVLFVAGVLFVVAAILAVVGTQILITIADSIPHDRYATAFTPLYLIAEEHSEAADWIRAAPGVLLLFALCCIIPAELLRRGAWSTRATTFPKGGTNVVTLNSLPVRTHVTWLLVALTAWVLLVPVPILLYLNRWWPATLSHNARDAVWTTFLFNGVIVALLFGMSAASLLKKFTYDARAAAGADTIVAGSRSVKFWRWFSHRWRMELTIGGLGTVFLGLIPPLRLLEYPETSWVMAGCGIIGLGFVALSIYLCLNSWRSGEDMRQVESVE